MSLSLVHYYPRAWIGDGGCTSAVRGWASALADVGARVSVVSDGLGTKPTAEGVRWLATAHRGIGHLRTPVGLSRLLEGEDLLILHSGWTYHNVRAANAAMAAGVPYLLTPHGAYEPNVFRRKSTAKQVWWTLFERELIARARAIHVFFEEQVNDLRRIGYTGPVVIAPNGLSLPPPAPPTARADYVLWMGRFDIETKGLDLLLQALASMDPGVRPQTRLHGPDWRGGKQETARLVNTLGLRDFVTIGPPLYGAEKWAALRECGAFVFPARWDGLSVMVLEAAAARAPLVMTNTTLIARYLAGQHAAVLVDATVDALSTGILAGLSSAGAEVGSRAGRVVADRFSWPAVAEDYANQVASILRQ